MLFLREREKVVYHKKTWRVGSAVYSIYHFADLFTQIRTKISWADQKSIKTKTVYSDNMETTTCTLPEHQSIKRAPKPRLCTATLPVKLEHSPCLGSLYTFGDLMCSLASHVILLLLQSPALGGLVCLWSVIWSPHIAWKLD